METLLQEGHTSLKNDLEDWKIEKVDGRKTIFYKGKNYIPKTKNYNKMWSKCTTITKQQDTQGNWKPTTQYDNIIGGQDFEHLWRITYKAVECVNSLIIFEEK